MTALVTAICGVLVTAMLLLTVSSLIRRPGVPEEIEDDKTTEPIEVDHE